MEPHPFDITVNPPQHPKRTARKPGKIQWAYLLAAYAIWALIFYSLSPLSRTEPARLAMRPLQVCLR